MNDEQLVGNKGVIDTEYERSSINYRPHFDYQPNKPFTVTYPVEQVVSPIQPPAPSAYQPVQKVTSQYEKFVKVSRTLSDLLTYIEERVKDTKIPLSFDKGKKLLESFPLIDQTILHNGVITFDDYKKTFDNPELPGNSLIQDTVTEYAEGMEGNLPLELYEDVKESELFLQEGFFMFKETLLKEMIDSPLPTEIVMDEEFLKKLDESIQAKKKAFKQKQDLYKEKEKSYYDSLKTEYGTPAYFQQYEDFLKVKREMDLLVREEKTHEEMIRLTDELLYGMEENANSMKMGLALGSDVNKEQVMKLLNDQTKNEQELDTLLKSNQLTLKLQLNQQVEEKKQSRDLLKNINNLSRKQRANDELLVSRDLRQTMYLQLYDTLQHLESPSKESGVESYLNQVAGGLQLIQNQYDAFLKDVYMMHSAEYEVRKEKLETVMEKEHTREGYKIVTNQV